MSGDHRRLYLTPDTPHADDTPKVSAYQFSTGGVLIAFTGLGGPTFPRSWLDEALSAFDGARHDVLTDYFRARAVKHRGHAARPGSLLDVTEG